MIISRKWPILNKYKLIHFIYFLVSVSQRPKVMTSFPLKSEFSLLFLPMSDFLSKVFSTPKYIFQVQWRVSLYWAKVGYSQKYAWNGLRFLFLFFFRNRMSKTFLLKRKGSFEEKDRRKKFAKMMMKRKTLCQELFCKMILSFNRKLFVTYLTIEKVQDESSGCSTPVAQPFVAKCYVPVILCVFYHWELNMT